MSLFQHPHLSRGIVRTPRGSFVVSRGIVEAPDDIGASLGWRPVETDADHAANAPLVRPGAASSDPNH